MSRADCRNDITTLASYTLHGTLIGNLNREPISRDNIVSRADCSSYCTVTDNEHFQVVNFLALIKQTINMLKMSMCVVNIKTIDPLELL